MTNLLETSAKLELKVTALQQEQAMSNLKPTVGVKVASRVCFITRSLARARSEAAEKSKNQYGLMGICSKTLEEGERRMVFFITVCLLLPRATLISTSQVRQQEALVRISVSG